MDKIVYNGEVRESGVHIYNRRVFDKECQALLGKKVTITIRKKTKRRSLEQNAYYWGVVVPMVRQGYFDVGYRYGIEETHTELKEMFRKVEKVNDQTGEIKTITGSTTDMSTVDHMDYIAQIQQWAAEYLSITIPDPGEQLTIEA